jgi:environmental stress-induced protein Ves
MDYKIINSEYFKPIHWSGGTTIELFIFPPTSDYRQRNFLFRLSTARVEAEESEFTSLPGISRKLMVLNGKINLSHEDHYSRQLDRFDVDTFEGDWKTSSVGKCTDFNLMTSGKTAGELSTIVLEKEQSVNCTIREMCDWFFVYIFSGKVRIAINSKIATLNRGDLMILNNPTVRSFEINGLDNSELVFSEISL